MEWALLVGYSHDVYTTTAPAYHASRLPLQISGKPKLPKAWVRSLFGVHVQYIFAEGTKDWTLVWGLSHKSDQTLAFTNATALTMQVL